MSPGSIERSRTQPVGAQLSAQAAKDAARPETTTAQQAAPQVDAGQKDSYQASEPPAAATRSDTRVRRPTSQRSRSQILGPKRTPQELASTASAGAKQPPPEPASTGSAAGKHEEPALTGSPGAKQPPQRSTGVNPGPAGTQTIDWTQNATLPQATRDQLVREAGADAAVQGQLQQIAQHPLYGQLSEQQRAQLFTVYATSNTAGRAELPALMGRQVEVGSGTPPPTAPALLTGDNARPQRTLLDNLHTLSTQPLDASVASRRGDLLGGAIQETAQPTWHLDQGRVGTCAPTSMQTHLIQHTPAEYVRLLGGLTGTSRSARMADGTQLDAARNDTAQPPTVPNPDGPAGSTIPDSRSLSERIFQSALQQHGDRLNNPQATFDANTDQTGLNREAAAHVMQGLYNRPYTATTVNPPTGQLDAPGASMPQRSAILGQIEREVQSGQGPVYASMLWGSAPPAGQNWGGHVVMVTQMDSDRVHFRNPWGSREAQGDTYWAGQNIAGPPPRRVEDARSGLESMTRTEFEQYLRGSVTGPPVGG